MICEILKEMNSLSRISLDVFVVVVDVNLTEEYSSRYLFYYIIIFYELFSTYSSKYILHFKNI